MSKLRARLVAQERHLELDECFLDGRFAGERVAVLQAEVGALRPGKSPARLSSLSLPVLGAKCALQSDRRSSPSIARL